MTALLIVGGVWFCFIGVMAMIGGRNGPTPELIEAWRIYKEATRRD